MKGQFRGIPKMVIKMAVLVLDSGLLAASLLLLPCPALAPKIDVTRPAGKSRVLVKNGDWLRAPGTSPWCFQTTRCPSRFSCKP